MSTVYCDMSINSRYTAADTGRAREMASTSSVHPSPYHRAPHQGASAADPTSFYEDSSSSSSDEELGMAGGGSEAADTRRLLGPRDAEADYPGGPVPPSSSSLYPQLARHHPGVDYHGQPPGNVAGGGGQGNGAHYGSVSSSLPSQGRNKTKWKRYRLPFLILLFFDCGLVIFLSIISYDSKVRAKRECNRSKVERNGKREKEVKMSSVLAKFPYLFSGLCSAVFSGVCNAYSPNVSSTLSFCTPISLRFSSV